MRLSHHTTSMLRGLVPLSATLALAAALFACDVPVIGSDGSSTTTPDTATDEGGTDTVDAGGDATPDTTADATPDTTLDDGTETPETTDDGGAASEVTDAAEEVGPDDAAETSGDDAVSTDASDGSDGADTLPAGCDKTGWVAQGGESALYDGGDDVLYVYSDAMATEPTDWLTIELLYYAGAISAPGTVEFTEGNYQDCVECLLIYSECISGYYDCATVYLARSGKLEIVSTGVDGANFTAHLTDVELAEVELSGDGFESTPIEDGKVWCVDSYDFDLLIEPF